MYLAFLIVATAFQVPADRTILWEQVSAGMPVDEARGLYPAGDLVTHAEDRITIRDHDVTADCEADVHVVHRGGRVSAVVLRGEPSIAGLCGTRVLEALGERYGRPKSSERRRPGLLKRARNTYVWDIGGVYLRYVHYAAGSGASALVDSTNVSWEMSFSTTDEPVSI